MTPLDILTQGKALIDTPEKWTQRAYARDARGEVTDLSFSQACRFCSAGAIHKVAVEPNTYTAAEAARRFLLAAADKVAGRPLPIIHFNDSHTHSVVMQMWDLAIELAKESK